MSITRELENEFAYNQQLARMEARERSRSIIAPPSSVTFPCAGKIWLDGWAGRNSYDVTVIRKTAKRYEVRNDSDKPWMVAGRNRQCWPGQTVLVPFAAVTFNPP